MSRIAAWTGDFEGNDFRKWSWWGEGDPSYGDLSTPTASSESLPSVPGGLTRVGKMVVPSRDRPHAKVYKGWPFAAPGELPDVSGTYRQAYYLPADYTVPDGTAVNIFQFKERQYNDGRPFSDPLWWINLSTASWALAQDGARWVGDRPPSDDRPVFMLNYWGNDWSRQLVFMAAPRGEWFEIRADLYQGDRIDFFVNDTLFDTASNEEYPVGPHQDDGDEWTFGTGNYTENPSTLYLGGASYEPLGSEGGMIDPEQIVTTTLGWSSGRSLTLAVPDGASEGDVLVAFVEVDGDHTGTLACADGLASRGAVLIDGYTFSCWTGVLAGEASITWTWGDVSTGRAGALMAIPGAQAVVDADAATGTSASLSSPSVTVPEGGIAMQVVANLYGTSLTGPAGFATVVEHGDPDDTYGNVYAGAVNGATGTLTTTTDGGTMPYAAWSLAIEPVPAPDPEPEPEVATGALMMLGVG